MRMHSYEFDCVAPPLTEEGRLSVEGSLSKGRRKIPTNRFLELLEIVFRTKG